MQTVEQIQRQVAEVDRQLESIDSLIVEAEAAVAAAFGDAAKFSAAAESLGSLEQRRTSLERVRTAAVATLAVSRRGAIEQQIEALNREYAAVVKVQDDHAARRDALQRQYQEEDRLAHIASDRASEIQFSRSTLARQLRETTA